MLLFDYPRKCSKNKWRCFALYAHSVCFEIIYHKKADNYKIKMLEPIDFFKNFIDNNEGSSLTIDNKGFSLTIVNETTNFIKRVVFGKTIVFEKNVMQLYWMSSYMKINSCGGAKTSWYFLLNDTYRCPSGRFPLFVNDRLRSLMNYHC